MIIKHLPKALRKGVTSSKLSQNNKQLNKKKKKEEEEIMEKLYKRFNCKTMEDWRTLSHQQLVNNGAKKLLLNYSNQLSLLLPSVFPNYPWNDIPFTQRKEKKCVGALKHLANQQIKMDFIFQQLKLKSLDDWLLINPSKISLYGGRRLFSLYGFQIESLLRSIYPHFAWDFASFSKTNSIPKVVNKKIKKRSLQSIDSQRQFMDDYFITLRLNSLDDWLDISRNKLNIATDGVIVKFYHSDKLKFLSAIYPNFPWSKFHLKKRIERVKPPPIPSTKIIDNQRRKMDSLFHKLHLKTLDQWLHITPSMIVGNRDEWLFKKYHNNLRELLTSLYPYYPWDIPIDRIFFKRKLLKSIRRRRLFMDKLFLRFHLKTFDDWREISADQIIAFGGVNLVNFYHRNVPKLLSSIYPNFPWNFDFVDEKLFLKSLNASMISIYRKRMDELFVTLKLNKIEEWIGVAQWILIQNIDAKLFSSFQHHFEVLSILYPNFPWSSLKSSFILHNSRSQYRTKYITHQEAIDQLFSHFRLTSLDDWLNVSIEKIMKKGGKRLLKYYSNDKQTLLTSIYPNYPWDFKPSLFEVKFIKRKKFISIDSQLEYMEKLFYQLQLNTLDDWIKVYQFHNIKKNKSYSAEGKIVRSSLSRLYPNFPWDFSKFIYEGKKKFLLESKIKHFIHSYYITQKKDWYRVSDPKYSHQTLEILRLFYPMEEWIPSLFNLRSKKSAQRLLFSFTRSIIPSTLILENYLHPKLVYSGFYELDLFIPALQLALEYQGEQHYDDLPSAFAGVESCQNRDEVKVKVANELNIKIVYIPYWWNRSISTLYSALHRFQFL